ncbi:hypothetical protein EVAR_74787_1 [Eumeta japonica]|uniref:Uncharacterized protein n=1 Tax=Eumeta variegata TaxID=151549 RepID=A0A4C1SS02_EUMVA|nr:hypothetical protein EVAR_74787_1 [Eumeta japonica]
MGPVLFSLYLLEMSHLLKEPVTSIPSGRNGPDGRPLARSGLRVKFSLLRRVGIGRTAAHQIPLCLRKDVTKDSLNFVWAATCARCDGGRYGWARRKINRRAHRASPPGPRRPAPARRHRPTIH